MISLCGCVTLSIYNAGRDISSRTLTYSQIVERSDKDKMQASSPICLLSADVEAWLEARVKNNPGLAEAYDTGGFDCYVVRIYVSRCVSSIMQSKF